VNIEAVNMFQHEIENTPERSEYTFDTRQKRMRKKISRWNRSRPKIKLMVNTRNIDGIRMAVEYAVTMMKLDVSFVLVASLE